MLGLRPMPKRATLLVWAGLSLAYSIGYRLVADAIVGWINDRIAEALSITSPSVMNVLTFVWSWGPPLVLAALTLWSYTCGCTAALLPRQLMLPGPSGAHPPTLFQRCERSVMSTRM